MNSWLAFQVVRPTDLLQSPRTHSSKCFGLQLDGHLFRWCFRSIIVQIVSAPQTRVKVPFRVAATTLLNRCNASDGPEPPCHRPTRPASSAKNYLCSSRTDFAVGMMEDLPNLDFTHLSGLVCSYLAAYEGGNMLRKSRKSARCQATARPRGTERLVPV